MAKKKKYYAVAVGKKPGIYTEWFGANGAEIQVRGFPGAVFKGFPTLQEAKDFLAQKPNRIFGSGTGKKTRRPAAAGGSVSKRQQVDDSATDRLVIYTDGGCINNPGPGGYGVVIQNGDTTQELSGGFRLTTNNRMELLACIVGLRALTEPTAVALHSDSRYVVNGITKGWAKKWRANGWMRNKTERAINPDLWAQLLDLCDRHDVKFIWVKGHAGNPLNERCDELATRAATSGNLAIDENYEA